MLKQSSHIQRGDLQLSIFLFILVTLKQVKVTGLVLTCNAQSCVRYFIQFLKKTILKKKMFIRFGDCIWKYVITFFKHKLTSP